MSDNNYVSRDNLPLDSNKFHVSEHDQIAVLFYKMADQFLVILLKCNY